MKKLYKLLFAFALFFTTVNIPNVSAEEGKDLGGIFTGAEVFYGVGDIETGTYTKLEDGDVFDLNEANNLKLSFAYGFDDGAEVKEGDYAKLVLPEIFTSFDDISEFTGNLKADGEVAGKYIVKENDNGEFELLLTFNDYYEERQNRSGTVEFLFGFDAEKFKEDAFQEIKIGEDILDITIIARPNENKTNYIVKSGIPDSNVNTSEINWSIDINTKLEDLEDVKLKDIIPDGLKLRDGSIRVYELTVGVEGDLGQGTEISNFSIDSNENSFEVDFGHLKNKAYRVEYTTDVIDSKTEYTNTATLNAKNLEEKEANFTVDELEVGQTVDKFVDNKELHDATEITWYIDVNKSELDLKNAILTDLIPEGLTVDSYIIHELNKDGNNFVLGDEIKKVTNPTLTDRELVIELGDLNKEAVRVTLKTSINTNVDEYNEELTFKNEVTLDTDNAGESADDEEVVVKRSPLVSKVAEDITSYGDSIIRWTVTVNAQNHKVNDAVFKDFLDNGLELLKDTVMVNRHPVEDGKLIVNEDNFTISLGTINEKQTIVYETKVTEKKVSYSNGYSLSGSGLAGSGITNGETERETVTIDDFKTNKFDKSKLESFEFDDTNYDGLNHTEQTMSWVLTVDPVKYPITKITITDNFEPKEAMVLLEDTFKILKYADDTLTDVSDEFDVDKNPFGFTATSNEELSRNVYYIVYKTSFNPNLVLEEEGTLNETRQYKNTANFDYTYKDIDGTEQTDKVTKDAEYEINETYFNGGKKDGDLTKAPGNREIEWTVYINAFGQELDGYSVVDELSEGQEFDKESLKIYEVTVSKSGNLSVNKDAEYEEYEITEFSSDGYTLKFNSQVSKPLAIVYKTKVVGVSKEEYTNTATTYIGDDENKTYEGKVTDKNYDKFVEKEALNLTGNNAYTDLEVNWQIVLNESLSEINNAKFTDVISNGHIYLNDTFKMKIGDDVYTEQDLEESAEFTFEITVSQEGVQTIVVELGDIDNKIEVTYDTIVVAKTDEKINNVAKLEGTDFDPVQNDIRDYIVKKLSSGTGGGTNTPLGKLVVNKKDEFENTITNPALFELSYEINGEKQIVDVDNNQTNNGLLEYENLSLNREYTLTEKESPDGFILGDTPYIHTFVLTKEEKILELDVENKYERIDVEASKDWVDGPEDDRPVIYFELYRNVEGTDAELVEDAERLLVDSSNTVKWEGLERTDIEGNEYIYSVREVDQDGNDFTPENYSKVEEGLTVTNQYQIPSIEVVATKEWRTAKELDEFPTVFFKLYRQLPEGEIEAVDVEVLEVDADTNTVVWSELEKTDINGVEYIYSVVEVDEDGNDYVPLDFNKEEEGLLVVNTYDPRTSFSVEKVWVNGDLLERPDVTVNLHQNGEIIDSITLNDENSWFYVFEDLPVIDEDGNDYEYNVDEVDIENYGKTIEYYESDRHFVITNTYGSALTDLTFFKVWENGPEIKPDIELQLFRNGEEYLEVVTLVNGEFSHTFKDLEVTDEDGKAYEYYVLEVSENELYEVEYDENTIINTYVSPTTTLKAEKVWKNAPKLKPTIAFQLYQNGEAYGDPVVLKNTTEVIWENVPITDEKGNEYVYTVDEVSTPKNYSKSVDGMVITNTYIKVPGTGIGSNAYYYLAILVVAMLILVLNTYPSIKRKYNK